MEFLTNGDRVAIGILLGVLGTLFVAFVYDWVSIIVAERSSAREYEHWSTTIREEN